MQGDSGRLGLACVTAEAGSIGSRIAQRTGEPAQPTGIYFWTRLAGHGHSGLES